MFTADGAGGFQATSAALREAVQEAGLPLRVETFEWSHGYARVISDQVGHSHAREAGRQLAGAVAAFRRCHPYSPVYLVGHSAGAAVVLAAAEELPPGSVEKIVLLAPSVSAGYDLRPALRCVRGGIDVFWSRRDWGYLGLGVMLVGTADGCWQAAAGRTGFRPRLQAPEDAELYCKLRQHAWNPCVEWTGNHGGHYGCHQPAFLRAYVLPLFQRPAEAASKPVSDRLPLGASRLTELEEPPRDPTQQGALAQ
jgi:pimeloyl-ACP methyl ester carboxylesterase